MSATSLKFLMTILMVLDHIGFFIPEFLGAIFHLITRPVAAVFAFMSVEAYKHTRSKKIYISRLYLSAFLMELGNLLINRYIIDQEMYYIHNNILLSLALGASSLYLIDINREKEDIHTYFLMILLMGLALFSEGGIIIVSFMILAYINDGRPEKRNRIYSYISLSYLGILLLSLDRTRGLEEILKEIALRSDPLIFISSLPFINLYNGKRGRYNRRIKYFFYLFYPAHLWLISIIADKNHW